MTNFTLNNHLKYSIGNSLYGYRKCPTEKFSVSLGAVDPDQYRLSNFENELRRTADSVYQEFGKDLIVFLSGGTDSEIVLKNFLSIGIKPKCVTIKLIGDYNIEDVKEAESIARNLNLSHEILDFDVKNFFYSGEASNFGEKIQCTQITYIMVYYHILSLNAPAVMGGEALLTRNVNKNESHWYYTFRENEDASAIRFSLNYNIPLVNEWFSYTPELLLFYLEHPDIQSLTQNRYNYKLSSVSSKNYILKKLCPYITEKKKTHGFEKLVSFNYESYQEIGSKQIKRLEPSLDGIPIDDALLQLRKKL